MVALSVGKKSELGVLSSMLAKTVWAVGLVAILASCGGSPGYSYTVGGTISGLFGSGLVLQNNAGDDRNISADGAFSFRTPLVNGAAYAVTIKTQPGVLSQTCTISNGNGIVAAVPVNNVVVSCVTPPPHSVTVDPSGEFAYVANTGSNNISAYTIDSTGALTAIAGSPFAAGTKPYSVTIDPSGQFAYVANTGDNTISAYTIDSTGALTAIAGSPFATGMAPYFVTVDPSGKFAYVANTGDNTASVYYGYSTISAYTIDSVTGALTPITGSPFFAGRNPYFVTIDPSGQFAYAANYSDNTISAYTIEAGPTPAAGTLIPIAGSPFAFATGTNPYSVTIDPSGKFAYVANKGSNNISAYTIDPTTGAFTAGTVVAAGTKPYFVTVDPSGKFAYVANTGDNTISAYTINSSTGVLTPITGSPFAAGTTPYFVTVDPSGKFAYAANTGSNNISAYTISSSTGVLTPITGSPFAAGTNPSSVTVDPSGQFAYTANYSDNNISAYTIASSTGVLTDIAGSPFAAGMNPY